MTSTAIPIFRETRPSGGEELAPPSWVREMLGLGLGRPVAEREAEAEGTSTRVWRAEGAMLVTVKAEGAVQLDAAGLQRRTGQVYAAIAEELRGAAAPHPVRFWNHIPSINERMADGRDRYMAFNAGRFDAFSRWYGGREAFGRQVATASGVGHAGRDLLVHCLAAAEPGNAIANPRQVPPFNYSRRFGPLPPCFARATVSRLPRRLLLVGGTASIRGEESLHEGDLAGQMRETLANLASVVEAAGAGAGGGESPLRQYRELRVYLPRPDDAPAISEMLGDAFSGLRQVEFLHAGLCRPELLVEIEGIAELPAEQAVEEGR